MLKSQHADPIRVAQLTAESLNASKTAGGRRDLPEYLQTDSFDACFLFGDFNFCSKAAIKYDKIGR